MYVYIYMYTHTHGLCKENVLVTGESFRIYLDSLGSSLSSQMEGKTLNLNKPQLPHLYRRKVVVLPS